MSYVKEMPATLLRLTGEVCHEPERSRAAHEKPGGGWPDHAQLQDGLDVDVFHVGFLVEMIVRRI